MKLALLGNCQVHGLAQGLGAIPGVTVTPFEVWRLATDARAAFRPGDWDLIISQPLNAAYEAMSADNLRASGRPLAFIHNLHFEGLFPDATYAGPIGRRLTGPMGDYHSAIVIHAFTSGLPVTEATRRLVEGDPGCDPAQAWAKSLAELRKRSCEVDVRFADDVDRIAHRRRAFWTFNHPEINLLHRYAERIAKKVLDKPMPAIANPADDLRAIGLWPVYPWVREAHGLTYGGETTFEMRGRIITASEFVERSYRVYEASPESLAPR